jgi:hypothetical protein
MAKKKYIVETVQTITQTWEYEVETDLDLTSMSFQDVMILIVEDGIEGHCLDNDKVISEEIVAVAEQEAEE